MKEVASDLAERLRSRRRRTAALLAATLAMLPLDSYAAESAHAARTEPHWLPGEHRGLSLQAVAGPLFSPFGIGPDDPSVRTFQTNLRLGWSFGSRVEGKRHWTDPFEILLEATYARIYEGPGRMITGSSLLLRYNTRPLFDRIAPYFQAGAGTVYADISRDRSQHISGQRFNFSLQLGAGLRYPIARGWSLDSELLYYHVSNAGLDRQNHGLNSLGGVIGFTRYFDAF